MSAAPGGDRAPVEHFERLARESEDPWDYATSAYEQAKYRRTLAALPERTGAHPGARLLGRRLHGDAGAALREPARRRLQPDRAGAGPAARSPASTRSSCAQATLPEETPGGPVRDDRLRRGPLLLEPGAGPRRPGPARTGPGPRRHPARRPLAPRRPAPRAGRRRRPRDPPRGDRAAVAGRGRDRRLPARPLVGAVSAPGIAIAALEAVVVVPARNEEERIGACLVALATQVEVSPGAYEVIVVLDDCSDETALVVEEVAPPPPRAAADDAGGARRAAPGRRGRPGWTPPAPGSKRRAREGGLLATTDADSVVAPDWIARQLEAIAAGAEAIGGEVDARRQPRRWRSRRGCAVAARRTWPRGPAWRGGRDRPSTPTSPAPPSASPRAPTAGPAEWGCWRRWRIRSWRTAWPRPGSRSTASARSGSSPPRAPTAAPSAASPVDLELAQWLARRSYRGADFDLGRLLAAKRRSVAVVLPARESRRRSGRSSIALAPLREAGLIDELLVVDADSADGTAAIAREHGAEVVGESALRPELGPCQGKGDAMWRAAQAVATRAARLPRRRHRRFRGELPDRPARAAPGRAGAAAGQGLLPAPLRRRRPGPRRAKAAGSPSWSRGRCSTSTSRPSPASPSRWPARSRSSRELFAASRSRSATGSRSRC